MFKWIGNTRTVQTIGFAGKVLMFMRFLIGFFFSILVERIRNGKKEKPKAKTLDELRLEFYTSLKDVDDQEMLLRVRNFWGMTRVMWVLSVLYLVFSLWNLYVAGIVFGLTLMAIIYLVMGYQIMIIRQCVPMPYRVFLRLIKKDFKQALPLQSPNHWADKLSFFRNTMKIKLDETANTEVAIPAHIEVAQ